jgi:hypothetical protein
VEIGSGFAGSTVKVTGTVPEGSTVVIRAVAPAKKVALSRKGRVNGLWITVERAQVDGMPGMYKVFLSGKMSEVPADVQANLGVDSGFTALKNRATVTEKHEEETVAVDKQTAGVFVDGFVALMAKKNLYTVKENAVTVNGNSFEAVIDIPADIPRGETTIEVYALHGSLVAASATAPLQVAPVGLVKTLGNMAQHHAAVYGLIAVVFALTAGILIAQFFKWLQKAVFKDEGVSAHH